MGGESHPFFIMATEKNSEELYFEWWLEELKKLGLVLEYIREPQKFILKDPVVIFYNQKKARSSFMKSFNPFPALTYTPDYRVIFSEKGLNKLFGKINVDTITLEDEGFDELGSVYQNVMFYTTAKPDEKLRGYELWFDVKPPSIAVARSGQLGSSRDFKYVSRMMFETHKIIVNKVVPIGSTTCLFAKTFMPRRYSFTDKGHQPRKLKSELANAKTIQQYLENKKLSNI